MRAIGRLPRFPRISTTLIVVIRFAVVIGRAGSVLILMIRHGGGQSTGAPKGNRNAWKHGLRSAEHRRMKALVRELLASVGDVSRQKLMHLDGAGMQSRPYARRICLID